ncbi:MAG: hypothetical protein H6977_14720 [Gammaproteobacteria bacterium]|nr:hypothetical protein [Gammaproteobacteria bacterium]MCP5201262.1 hypothetical protein [Gammaproteobacteria bacterium]
MDSCREVRGDHDVDDPVEPADVRASRLPCGAAAPSLGRRLSNNPLAQYMPRIALFKPKLLRRWRTFLQHMALCSLLVACNPGDADVTNLLYPTAERTLATRTRITGEEIRIPVEPPLEIRHDIQYVALGVSSPGLWEPTSRPGILQGPDGQAIQLDVRLEDQKGNFRRMDSVSFGKDLLFSNVSEPEPTPSTVRYVAVRLSSRPEIVVDRVGWIDTSNK